jgi:DNA-binding FrmR family transcriptional regulator
MIRDADRKAMLSRLARVEGQIRGLQRLISEENTDCEKVAQQMSAARKALDKAGHAMLACMVHQMMEERGEEGLDIEAMISKYA